MVPHRLQDESANAEILGVVILMGIFAITAGIISATTLSSSPPSKVPAASIEITNSSETTLRFIHNGGDPLPLDAGSLVVRGTRTDDSFDFPNVADWLGLEGETVVKNGFVNANIPNGDDEHGLLYKTVTLIWQGPDGGSAVLASWGASSGYGPLGPSSPSGGEAGAPFIPRTQPPVPTPTTNWNTTLLGLHAGFSFPSGTFVPNVAEQFTDTSTGLITNWAWNFGDGTGSSLQNPTHEYEHYGSYSVSLTVSNLTTGASDTIVRTIEVVGGTSPVVFDVSPPVGGNSLTVTCTDQSTCGPTIWQWTFIDGRTGTTTVVGPYARNESYNPAIQTFTFRNPAGTTNNTCTVWLTIWSPYIESPVSASKTVIVGPPLVADFSSNVTIGVSPQIVRFFDTSIGIPQTWLWDFGDGTTSTEQNPVHIFTVGPGEIRTFHVTLTVSGWDQNSTATHDITVYPPVVADFKAVPTEGEAPLTVAFTDISTGFVSGWRWNFGDGTNSTEQNPVHIFSSFGAYDVTLFVERAADPHSADEKTIPVYIRVGPVVTANFTANMTSGPSPLTVQFTNTSTSADPSVAPLISWSWDFGDSTTSTEENPMHAYATSGNYTVSLTAANAYRYATMTKVGFITVFDPVTANFTANQTAGPVPMSVQFTDRSGGDPTNWSWDFNGNGDEDSTIRNPLATYLAPGDYVVNLTAWNHLRPDLTSTKLETIRVYAPPVASFTTDPMATPLWMNFTDTSTGNPFSWSWDFGDGMTSSARNPMHLYNASGNYTVALTVTNPLGTDTSVRTAYITGLPP